MKNSITSIRKVYLAIGAFFFRFRNAVFPSIFLVIFFALKPSLQMTHPTFDRFMTILGILIAVLGAIVRLSVIGFAYIKRGGKDGEVYADDLVMEGLYAHSRNPMYVGNILIALGIGSLYGSPLMYGIVMPFFLFVYLCIVAKEEDYLSAKFGSRYAEYCKNVPRFIPKLRGLGSTVFENSYDWRKAIRSDYGTFSATISGIMAVLIWKSYHLGGLESAISTFQRIGIGFMPVLIFYSTVYFLKHSGRLVSRT